mgnify:CR=1 FL=1
MPYIGRSTDGFGVRNRFIYLASSGDTSVSGADANGATLTFTDGAYVDVYLNGVLLKPTTDYNTSTANTIAGLSALNTNDEVTVVVYDVFTVADMVSATSGGTFSGAVTANSTLDMNGTELILDADGDTSITADTDDQIDFKLAGSDLAHITSTYAKLRGATPLVFGENNSTGTFQSISGEVGANNLLLRSYQSLEFKNGTSGSSLTDGTTRFKINSNGSVGIASDVTTGDLNIGAGVGSYATIQMTTGGTSTGNIIYFGDSGDADYSSITSFGSGAGENGRMRFIVGTTEALNIFNDADITSTGSRFKLGAAGSRTVISPGTGVTVTLADDASTDIAGYSGSSSAILLIYDAGGGGAVYYHTYQSTVTKLAGLSDYATSDSDGNTCVFKSGNSHTVTLKNREGASVNYYVIALAAYD